MVGIKVPQLDWAQRRTEEAQKRVGVGRWAASLTFPFSGACLACKSDRLCGSPSFLDERVSINIPHTTAITSHPGKSIPCSLYAHSKTLTLHLPFLL